MRQVDVDAGADAGASTAVRPALGFIGIHAGRRVGQPVSQNEVLAGLFETAGYTVRRASTIRQPYLRTLHHLLVIPTWRRVDVLVIAVFSGRSFTMAELATLMGRLSRKKTVLFLHGGNLPVFGPAHRRRVERVFARADLILAPSDYLAEVFRGWGLDVRVIPNVLDTSRYRYKERVSAGPRLLWMRTFHEDYNPLMAVRVLERVARVHPEATLTMAGADHGLLAATRAEAERLGVAERITFPGYVDHEQKLAAFASHDLFLNTNVIDNMPVSVIEATLSGLVPVATAVGGLPSIIDDGENGVLVDSDDDDEAMAGAVLGLIGEPERFAAMSRAAHALGERSSWPNVRRRWEEELVDVCRDDGTGPGSR